MLRHCDQRIYLAGMSKLFVPLFCASVLLLFPGCGWGKKKPASSARLYEGETSPNIHYNDERETAGGRLNPL
jgi:hypothetical protein